MGASHFEYLYSLNRYEIKPGLERIEVAMEALGHPERQFKSIHIAGTNGKGSVAAMMESVLRASGLKTALYTSPDIYSYHERTKINGISISDEDLASLTWELKKVCDDIGLQLTFFEFGTALTYLYFARQKVDIAIIEVGMGGLLDATNVITPILSVITNVGLDHQEFLGETKQEIAREKAGIIKPGVPVVTGEQDSSILELIKSVARENSAPLTNVHQHIEADVIDRSWNGQQVRVSGAWAGELLLPLLGQYQVENLKTALVALATFAAGPVSASFPRGIASPHLLAGLLGVRGGPPSLTTRGAKSIGWEAVVKGIAATTWPGRLDVVSEKPLIIVDGAHNADGMRALIAFLDSVPRRDVLVFGLKSGKTIDEATRKLISMFDHVIVSEGNYQPQPAGSLAAKLQHSSMSSESRVAHALEQARELAGEDGTIVVAGSLYLIADALGVLRPQPVPLAHIEDG